FMCFNSLDRAGHPLSSIFMSIVNPFARITRVFIVGPSAGNSRNLWNPILTQEIVRVTILLGQLTDVVIIQSRESSVTDDRMLLPRLCGDRERRKKQMNVQMAVEEPVFTGPFFFRRAPERAESHVNHARAAPLPFETAGGMFLDPRRAHYFGISANRDFPEVEQARSRETGVLCRATLIQQASPGVSVSCAAGNF